MPTPTARQSFDTSSSGTGRLSAGMPHGDPRGEIARRIFDPGEIGSGHLLGPATVDRFKRRFGRRMHSADAYAIEHDEPRALSLQHELASLDLVAEIRHFTRHGSVQHP